MAVDGHLNFDTKINLKGYQKDMKSISSSLDKLKSQFKGLAAMAAAAFSVKKIIDFGQSCKDAWQVQMEAETRLEQVMKNTMGATREQIQATKEWASELQKVGVIGDEITLSGLQELGTYVENADSLKTMSVVLDDMLAQQYGLNATAENAVSISTMLGKVLEGQTSALSRYGYKFTEAQEQLLKYGTEEQRVATLAEVVEASVGGMNEALARTPAGRLKQISNTMGDVKEQFGKAITNIQALFLPALERIASGLARIADLAVSASEALANVFGISLNNTAAVTSNISASISAQEELTDAVNETNEAQKNSLASFDKINTLSSQESSSTSNDEESGVSLPVSIDDSNTEKKLDKLSEKLQKLIDPIKIAWEDNSQTLIDNAKRAAKAIKDVFGSIKSSIADVWTNGSGERFTRNIIILFSDVLGIIGDIATALKNAWNDGGRGTAVIQSYFDRWNALLELIHVVGQAFRDAWNDGTGEEIFGNILEILINLNKVWTNLRTQFIEAWTENERGTRIFSAILGVINTVLDIVRRLVGATAEWAANLDFSPILDSIAELFEAIDPLVQTVGDALLWVYKNVLLPIAKWTIEKAAPTTVTLLANAFKLLTAVLNKLKTPAKWIWDNFLKPLGKWAGDTVITLLKKLSDIFKNLADLLNGKISIKQFLGELSTLEIVIGSIITAIGILVGADMLVALITHIATLTTTLVANAAAWIAANAPIVAIAAAIAAVIAIGVLLIKHWDEIKEFMIGVWDSIKEAFSDLADWFTNLFTRAWEGIKKAWGAVVKWFSDLWESIKQVFAAVGNWFKEKFQNAWDGITGIFKGIGNWFGDRWSDIKNAFSAVGSWFGEIFSGAWNNIKSAFSSVNSFFSGVWGGIKNCFGNVTDWFKDKFSAAWQAIKDVFTKGGAIFEGISDSISDIFTETVNSLIDGINWVIAQPFEGINWALGKIRDVSIFGMEPFSWMPTIDIPEIPHLATGTVIPANYGNFLATLGDNRREPEVVSPISAIEQAVENVLARINGNQTIHVHLDLDGREIGRVAVKAVHADNTRRGL